jgi:hypothetical protein
MMGRFDVSEIELSEASHKRWSNRDGLSKHAKFPRKNTEAHPMARNKPSGCLGSRRRYSMIVDITHSGTAICVAGAVAIEVPAFSARLTSTQILGAIFENLSERAWTAWWGLTWREDVSEAGESCGDPNYRRVGEGWADHNGTLCGTTADWDCGDFRRRDTSRIVAATLRHRALAVGEVIRR